VICQNQDITKLNRKSLAAICNYTLVRSSIYTKGS